ncbi:Lcl C-terminal domain-containing protein [Ideonella paludis]|uniref:Lcl C-terminal domain-containing protein n=1 Tax=Ideonella paludis TaxID=1233411 RepID=UPI0036400C71
MTASQCYTSGGGTVLSACSSASAVALNGQQDGHRTSVNAMSFSRVGSYTLEECVKDDVTGLVWEGKATSGLRAGSTLVNHIGFDRPDLGVVSTSYYVAAANTQRLCGYADWRLPTLHELQSIADYSKASPGPVLASAWLVNTNTSSGVYWSATPEAGSTTGQWVLDFRDGLGFTTPRQNANGDGYLLPVRLVRGAP